MEGDVLMRSMAFVLAAALLAGGSAHAGSIDDDARVARVRFESLSRAAASNVQTADAGVGPSLLEDRLRRVGHGAWSLLLPGLSQYRSGHNGRAVAFFSVEALVWGSYAFSQFQGYYREDQYREFAGLYAGVEDTDRDDDDYWRSVGIYVDTSEYNEEQRRVNRAEREQQIADGGPVTVDLDDGLISEADGWEWSSERRRQEYRSRRADALSSFDRANISLLFAVLNRIVAFADAVRSGPPSDDPEDTALVRAGRFALDVDFDPSPVDPSAQVKWGTSF